METHRLNVAIVGAGIGGLCLAQALKQAGLGVRVFERDESPAARSQGYRLHLSPVGSLALYRCLPRARFQRFVAACGRATPSFTFVDPRLRPLLRIQNDALPDPIATHRGINRGLLREILLQGLEDVVEFNRTVTGYELSEDNVALRFRDGAQYRADVVVGADAGKSAIRRQLLPQAEPIDTGVRAIAGECVLSARIRATLPACVQLGPVSVVSGEGVSLFLAPYGSVSGDSGTDDGILWALGSPIDRMPLGEELEALSPDLCRNIAVYLTRHLHPSVATLIGSSATETVRALRFRTAPEIEAWAPSRVTLMGDAIHSMPPYRGIGANVALRDAEKLSAAFISAANGERPLLDAIGNYEGEMRRYGFAAVHASEETMKQALTHAPWRARCFRTALRTFEAIPPLKRFIFNDEPELVN